MRSSATHMPLFRSGLRSCIWRTGTRYHTRGIDVDGNVANFNETEQIVIFQDKSVVRNCEDPERRPNLGPEQGPNPGPEHLLSTTLSRVH